MSSRRAESASLTSGVLIAGILGGSLCYAGPLRAQSADERRQSASPVVFEVDTESPLKASTVLSIPARRRNIPQFSADLSPALSLAQAPAIALPAAQSPGGSGTSSLEPFNERPTPYDPTAPASGSGGLGAWASGSRREDSSAPSVLNADAEKDGGGGGLLAGLGGFGWGLAPLRWGGTTGVQFSRHSSSGGTSSSDVQEFLNLRGASYIYQPWLAQINGTLNLTKSQAGSSSGAAGPEGGATSSRQGASAVTGGGALNLFPSSRFPFTASFDRSDSRTTSDLVTSDYINTRYSVRQAYRPEDGSYSVQGAYDHSALAFTNQATASKDTVDSLSGGFMRNAGPQRLQADGYISRSLNDQSGASSRLIQLNSQFAYQLEDNLSYNSMASLTDTTFSSLGEKGMVSNHGRYMQFNSYVNWQPEGEEEDIPLFVTAGVRTLSSLSESAGSSNSSRSVGGNVSANYIYSPNLSLQGNALLTQVTGGTEDKAQLFSLLGGGVTYTGDPLVFGKVTYTWSAAGNGSRQTVPAANPGVDTATLTLSGQLHHGLTTPFRLSEVSTIYLTGTQSLAETSDSVLGNTTTLSHTAGANYSVVTGEKLQMSLGVNYSDTLTSGRTEGHYRFLNMLVNGQMQINTHSSFGANLSFQLSASDNPSTPVFTDGGSLDSGSTKQSNLNIYGSANYQNQRAFGVKGLRYNADFTANTLRQNERMFGNASAAPVGATYSLSNRLTYRIGLLDFEARAAVNITAGRENALIFFRAYRDFGGF